MKILHLEDVQSDALLIFHTLKKKGLDCDIKVVDNKKDFIAALDTFCPDVILSDHSLPSFNSKDALEILQASEKKIPFILLTATMTDEFAVEILQKGATDYILKDRLERLPSAINNAFEKFQLEKDRQEYVEKLIGSEKKLRRLLENGTDGVLVLTPEMRASYISPSAEKILGFPEEELAALELSDFIHPEDIDTAKFYLQKCLQNPGISQKDILFRVRHKNGNIMWIESSFTNLLHDPDINGIVDNFREVTERVVSENAIRDSEEKYRSFFENSLEGIIISEPDGRIFSANPAACEILQMTEEEICKRGRDGVVDLSDERIFEALKERDLKGKTVAELTYLKKDGSKIPVEVASSIYLNASGEKRSTIIFRDISERKQVQTELENSRERYKLLFQNSPLPNWIYDLETLEILDVNHAAVEHYGYTREEFLRMKIHNLRRKGDIPLLMEDLAKLEMKEKDSRFGIFNHCKKDGTQIKVEVYGYPLEFDDVKARLVVCIDITEKEEVLNKLREKREKLLTAQEISKLGYWEINLKNNSLYWTGQVYKIWEVDPKNYSPSIKDFLKSIHPEDRRRFEEERQKAIDTDTPLDSEHRIILPTGETKWVHERGQLKRDRNGVPILFEGTVQDINERKINLEKLRVSEARNSSLLKSQTNYLTRINLEGKYVYCNEKFARDFSWIFPNGKIVGHDAMTTIQEYHRERVLEEFHKIIKQPNTVFQVEIDKLEQNGGVQSTLWDFVCLLDSDGQPFEVQGVGIDISDRVKAERSLKGSNERYELVSKATSDAIWDWDQKTGTLFWSENFSTLFGHDVKNNFSYQQTWEVFLHPHDKDRVVEDLNECLAGTRNNWEAEYRFRKANGAYAQVIDRGFVIRDEFGNATRMVGAVQDITENKKLQELLQTATALSRVGSFEADLVNNQLFWSPMTKEIHEVAPDYIPEIEHALNFYKEGVNRDIIKKAMTEVVSSGESFDLELEIVTARGREKWIRVIGMAEIIEGRCTKINGSFQDIDKLKKAQLQAIKASEENETILESIGDAFFATNGDFTVTYWNKHAEALLNTPKKIVLGENLWEKFPDAVGSSIEKHYRKALRENRNQHFEAQYLDSWFEIAAYPSSKGLSVYFKDISARKEADDKLLKLNRDLQQYTEELVTANKGLEQFTFIVSHNLRSPVANILGLANLLEHEEYPSKLKERFFQELLSNVKRLDGVIGDLNEILQVRIEPNAKKEPVQWEEMVNSIKMSIEDLIEREHVKIETDFSSVSEFASVRSYLHSIFYNLIINSIKYRRPELPPEILIKSEKTEDGFRISFKDNGLGIDLSRRGDQVFGLYKRFHHHVEGKGMGLFMVKAQVEMLQGKITVNSEVNKGTEFLIYFKDKLENVSKENEQPQQLYCSR